MTESPLTPPRPINHTFNRRLGLILTGIGLVFFLLGAVPNVFGLDNSEAVGFVQVGVFTIGLLLICLGGSFALGSLWPDHWRSIAADFGLRIAWSGWVLAAISALADIVGLGTQPLSTSYTFFGFWQARGVLIGEGLIFVGFALMIPFKKDFPPRPADPETEEPPSPGSSVSISIEED